MGVDAEMFVRIPRVVSDAEVQRWSYIFGSMCHHHLFLGFNENVYHKPLERLSVYEQDGDDINPEPGETFLGVPLAGRYYGEGYERGPLLTYIGIAEFLETLIPEGRVWYGGDSSGICAEPFPRERRQALLDYAARVAHEPYESHFTDLAKDGVKAPECPVCAVTMPRCGWGPNYALFRCSGCGWEIQYRDAVVVAGFNLSERQREQKTATA